METTEFNCSYVREKSFSKQSERFYVRVPKHLQLGPVMNQLNQDYDLLGYDAVLFGR
jgi:truncated hemoglobin YjbI